MTTTTKRATQRFAGVVLIATLLPSTAVRGHIPDTDRAAGPIALFSSVEPLVRNPGRVEPEDTNPWLASPQEGLRSRLPTEGTGTVSTTHLASGMRVEVKPKGLYVTRADGARELLAEPNPVLPLPDGDGGLFYHDLYPGISTRYHAGEDFLRLEVVLEDSIGGVTLADGDQLRIVWLFDMNEGGTVVSMPEPFGGIVILDDASEPALWLTEPVLPYEELSKVAGAPPVLYEVELVNGILELSMQLSWHQIQEFGTVFPKIVHANTIAVLPDP